MWLLIILAVNINNPADIPGRVSIEFDSEQTCERALLTMEYKLKFDGFRVIGQCVKKS